MRCGIFVDAGYLFAQGSSAIFGEKKPRVQLSLDRDVAVGALVDVMTKRAPNVPLLRIYWYDGAGYSGPSEQHLGLAYRDDVKIRLGFLNSQGQQKGVDSLIVTDLIDLARNRAICDAILLSGDEDVRVGVHIAQAYGVRVHLLGISPSRGSQSQLLLQESDTTSEWGKDVVSTFLTAPADLPTNLGETVDTQGKRNDFSEKVSTQSQLPPTIEKSLEDCARSIASELSTTQIESITANALLPKDVDGRLLTTAAIAIGRQLEVVEKRKIREVFKKLALAQKKPT
jgi:hypothetical protein